mmetsp:Transcript_19255/g.47241  ORF Transcript_19255/g.47241 Transcript_19255/m.47241 type:complete len:231 (-) Transcript_19255:136-828(-)|eukprot:CAMPEP_0198311912 /NCGR_PEP_ID=MMETSP1450-20131203/3488_1 /TAXON_ID=753684 ORGANISM="Madagascaria erythrocladiodes, Strain CCMP3234" /NCGR_SAMPLE_ID=MMETSP1450 /ASSEMBLY_ACC=CAM_ASM_001115 /LENGTH=230 /DNA_ID=CAMNT_0044014831 /DNA_START=51 /DNA_END=743 /DNA_ORIENTATION=+
MAFVSSIALPVGCSSFAAARRANCPSARLPPVRRARIAVAPTPAPRMSLSQGDRLPEDASFATLTDGKRETVKGSDLFGGKTVVLFAVPGPFTPTCDASHFPSFVKNLDALKGKGVDTVACTAVSDAFVMDAWCKSLDGTGKITMLADGDASFAKSIGLTKDTGDFGGIRSTRYSMLVVDGQVVKLNVDAGGYSASSGETMVEQLSEGVDPLVAYCAANPEADECRTYED